MLKELFEGSFYVTYERKPGVSLNLRETTCTGDFTLLDQEACRGCVYVCSDTDSEREQLKVHADHQAYIIKVADIFSYIKGGFGEISDYMIDTTASTAVVEMTCSTTDYVKDKRAKARRQLYNTLLCFNACHTVKQHIEQRASRYAIFSWRETMPQPDETDSIEVNMRKMMLLTDEVYSPDNESNFDFGFKLKEIRYPHVLVLE